MSQGRATLPHLMRDDLLSHASALGCRVVVRPLPEEVQPGIYWPRNGAGWIFIEARLSEADKDAVLAHEMTHHLRGTVADDGSELWTAVVAREEGHVRRLSTTLIVPVDDLAEFCDRMADLGEGVGPEEVMHEFDCTRRVAEDALDNLMRHERGDR